MKHILTLILAVWCFTASAQHSYISSSGDVLLYSGSIEVYSSPYIYVDFTYRSVSETWVATLQLTPTLVLSAADGVQSVKTYQLELDAATVDALTCSGATNSEDISNCFLQAIDDYLTALNGGTTFTLH